MGTLKKLQGLTQNLKFLKKLQGCSPSKPPPRPSSPFPGLRTACTSGMASKHLLMSSG